jgi:hypothetical protein
MNTFCEIITGTTAIWLFFIAFIMETKNFRSMIIFKMLPFLLGLGNGFVTLYLLDIIKLNIK